MNERIKQIRLALNLTQQQFAERINLKRNTIAAYEAGKITISDRTAGDICKEFKVNKEWLLNGTGEIFVTENVELIALLGSIARITDDDTPGNVFKRDVISALSHLSPQLWEDIANELEKIKKEQGE